MTEMCFVNCVDNFFTRDLTATEQSCLDKCVLKFSNVNQRVMAAYVRDQATINERRMKEMEEQARANEAALAASAAATAETPSITIPVDTIDLPKESAAVINPLSSSESINSTQAPTLEFSTNDTDANRNHSHNLVT